MKGDLGGSRSSFSPARGWERLRLSRPCSLRACSGRRRSAFSVSARVWSASSPPFSSRFQQAHQKRVAEGADLAAASGPWQLQLASRDGAPWCSRLTLGIAGDSGRGAGVRRALRIGRAAPRQSLDQPDASPSSAGVGGRACSTQMAGKGLRFAATVACSSGRRTSAGWPRAARRGSAEIVVGAYILIAAEHRPPATRRHVPRLLELCETSPDHEPVRHPQIRSTGFSSRDGQVSRRRLLSGRAGALGNPRTLTPIRSSSCSPGFAPLRRAGRRQGRRDRRVSPPRGPAPLIAVPAAFGLWLCASPSSTLVYGERFLPALDPLMIFVVAALARPRSTRTSSFSTHGPAARFVPWSC